MKKKLCAIFGLVFALLLLGCFALAIFVNDHKEKQREIFLKNISTIGKDVAPLVEFMSLDIRRIDEKWYHLNGGDINLEEELFYTKEGFNGVGGGLGATFSEFSSSTMLSKQDIETIVSLMDKYPFIGAIKQDRNINLNCQEFIHCAALKIYLQPSFLEELGSDLSSYTSGFLYAPGLTDSDYLQKYFTMVTPIRDSWHAFVGEHY